MGQTPVSDAFFGLAPGIRRPGSAVLVGFVAARGVVKALTV